MSRIILIGDSIRMGYQRFVQDELSDEADVWGPSENGGTSANVLAHLEEWVISRNPDIVHINCGLHDISRASDMEADKVPLREYQENVDQILQTILERTNAKVIWAMTTPVNEQWHHENKSFERLESDVKAYNHAADQIAQKFDVQLDDLYEVVMNAGRDKILSEDGVHFTEEGYVILGRAVADAVQTCLT